MAGGAIDLDEIATPEILEPRQVEGLHSGRYSRMGLRAGPWSRALMARVATSATPWRASAAFRRKYLAGKAKHGVCR